MDIGIKKESCGIDALLFKNLYGIKRARTAANMQ
jgi:hypothetical protein